MQTCSNEVISDMNNIQKFQEYLGELEHLQTDKHTECINIFNFVGKCLKGKHKKYKFLSFCLVLFI